MRKVGVVLPSKRNQKAQKIDKHQLWQNLSTKSASSLSLPFHYTTTHLTIYVFPISLAQRKQQHSIRAWTWFRTTTIPAVAMNFPTAAWSWKASCADINIITRTVVSHAEWFRMNYFNVSSNNGTESKNSYSFLLSERALFVVINYLNAQCIIAMKRARTKWSEKKAERHTELFRASLET